MLIRATCLLLIAFSAADITEQTSRTKSTYSYFFGPDQSYAVVDLAAGRVVSSGQITELTAVTRADFVSSGQQVLVQAVSPADPNPLQPREQLALLTQISGADGPRLSLVRWLKSPSASSSLIWNKLLTPNLLLASWQDDRIQTSLYDATFNPTRTLDNFRVTPTTCLSSDGQTIYSVAHSAKREIKVVNLSSLAVKESSYASIGNATAYYRAPAASDGCVIAFIERMTRETVAPAPATIYLHDVETNRTLRTFNVAGGGRFELVVKRNLLVLDLTSVVPNKLPDGTTVGLRRASAGSLILYNTTAGNETARIPVPTDGALASVSSDGTKAYYLSPNLLTVIDLVNHRVATKVPLPFPYGTFLAASETQRETSGRPPLPPSTRKGACGCYACGVLLAVDFPNKSPDCFGTLATDACPAELAQLPDKGAAYCKQVRTKSKDGSLTSCAVLSKYCDSLEK